MKYKVGDSVVIRKDLNMYSIYGGYYAVDSMLNYLGKTTKIEVVGNGFYKTDLDYHNHVWSDEMIDHEATSALNGQTQPTADNPHYDKDVYEPLKIIDHYGLDFYEGNVLKYLLRWKKKDGVKDLKKAADYLNRLIEKQS